MCRVGCLFGHKTPVKRANHAVEITQRLTSRFKALTAHIRGIPHEHAKSPPGRHLGHDLRAITPHLTSQATRIQALPQAKNKNEPTPHTAVGQKPEHELLDNTPNRPNPLTRTAWRSLCPPGLEVAGNSEPPHPCGEVGKDCCRYSVIEIRLRASG